ncbi:acyl-CoA dehydrogenase family protein [Streptomyces canus]|uniref:acyl-CoA dehydrogenase family protein n=1 Tax=Streptomyces canus TaxID=58343 RepID=UPI002E2A9B60|nr:acyl-CoA dehydrogenase family protein [Streptomyces canus]
MTHVLNGRDAPASGTETLAALAAKTADEADRTGVLAPDVIAAFADSGIPRHFVPARWGGTDGGFTELTRTLTAVGQSCAAAAWIGSMFAYTARFATHLPVRAQEEVWADSPDTLWVPGLVPTGQSVRTEGGHRLSGRWTYVSGVEFADWALLAGPQHGPDASPPLFHAVPRAHFTVEHTWDAVGMRATGSHTVVLDDVEVPAHRTVPLAEVLSGFNKTSRSVQHNVPLAAVGGLTCIAPVLGAARSALSACVATVTGKRTGAAPGGTAALDGALARAAAELDSAALLVERVATVLDAGESRVHAMRNARDAAYAGQLLRDAVGGLMKAAGTAAQDRGSALQRNWRDVSIATSHAALRLEKAASAYADSLARG